MSQRDLNRVLVLGEVSDERDKQEKKWGQQNHVFHKYFHIVSEEYGEAAKEVVEATFAHDRSHYLTSLTNLRTELIQTAACCVAMIESLDRNEFGASVIRSES